MTKLNLYAKMLIKGELIRYYHEKFFVHQNEIYLCTPKVLENLW